MQVDYEDELHDEARYVAPVDPVDDALGAQGRLERAHLPDCRESFNGGQFWRDPEVFDRQYWQPPVLVDILDDFDQAALEADRQAKHVDFKTRWCREHDRAYLVLTVSEAQDPELVRAAYARLSEPDAPSGTPRKPAAPKPKPKPRRSRSKVQRPRAR